MKRREFILALGGAAAWPLAARAQQAIPVIGFLRSSTEAGSAHFVAAFRQGLSEAGYREGRDVTIEYRWGDGRAARLPELAVDLVSRRVAVIVSNYGAMAAAMAATKTIPIVFCSGDDPVTGGLVGNLNRPGGNVTGISFFDVPLSGKRLGLLHEVLPRMTPIGLLLDPRFVAADSERRELEAAARALGRELILFNATNENEIEGASSVLAQSTAGALLVGAGSFLNTQRRRIVALAAGLAIPAIYVAREFVTDGGLMSYGASQPDAYRRAGGYVGRILKGEEPAEMPVELPTKFELVINLKTTRTLGLTMPSGVLAIADEVIE
jgi:putative tryptophan/tyrosine transport system substrate-binding protein